MLESHVLDDADAIYMRDLSRWGRMLGAFESLVSLLLLALIVVAMACDVGVSILGRDGRICAPV